MWKFKCSDESRDGECSDNDGSDCVTDGSDCVTDGSGCVTDGSGCVTDGSDCVAGILLFGTWSEYKRREYDVIFVKPTGSTKMAVKLRLLTSIL